MCEHDALGHTGGARRIDDGGEILGPRGIGPQGVRFRARLGKGLVLPAPDPLQGRSGHAGSFELGLQLRCGRERASALRIRDQGRDLRGGQGGIDGNGHRADREDRDIRDHPLDAALGENHDAVAALHPALAQSAHHQRRAPQDVIQRHPSPAAFAFDTKRIRLRMPFRGPTKQLGHRTNVHSLTSDGPCDKLAESVVR